MSEASVEVNELESKVRELAATNPDLLKWSWDDRFLMMLAVVEKGEEPEVRDVVRQHFPHTFTADQPDLSRSVNDVIAGLGGLRSGQRLFVSSPNEDPMVFGAWWPWRGNQKISLRLGVWSARMQGPERRDLGRSFRDWFGGD